MVQECENPELSSNSDYSGWSQNYIWKGKNKNRGIGIFSIGDLTIEEDLDFNGTFSIGGDLANHHAAQWGSSDIELFLPVKASNGVQILGVWTKGSTNTEFSYIGQFWKYLQTIKGHIRGKEQIICGDFNSNSVWDKKDRWWNHSDVVAELKELGLTSLYHLHSQENNGEESQPTFFRNRKIEKGYHIDYFFTSTHLSTNSSIEVGGTQEWLEYSDHLPMTVSLQLDS